MSEFNVNEDRPGFCCKCHTPVAEFRGSNAQGNPIVVRLLPNLNHADFVLDDGSLTRIVLCTACKENLQPEDSGEIMENVINGWQYEVNQLGWDEKRKLDYMTKFSKRFIVNRSDKNWDSIDLTKVTRPTEEKLRIKIHPIKNEKESTEINKIKEIEV